MTFHACRAVVRAVFLAVACVVVAGLLPVAASANMPWWHLTTGARPSYLPVESKGQIVLIAANRGDAPADGQTSPITITDTLPAGLEATAVEAVACQGGTCGGSSLPLTCQGVKAGVSPTCSFTAALPAFNRIEMTVKVKVLPDAKSGEINEMSISGGGAPPASASRPVRVAENEEPIPFGLETNELTPEEDGGATDTQAGSHPFQVTSTLVLNQELNITGKSGGKLPGPVSLPKNIDVHLPPGFIGNPKPIAQCTMAQFLQIIKQGNGISNACPAQSAIGVVTVAVTEPFLVGFTNLVQPLFNIQPAYGEPARFGFFIEAADTPVILDASLRSGPGGDYGVDVDVSNITQTAALLSSEVTFWGTPGDPRHDSLRGWGCLAEAHGEVHTQPCSPSGEQHPPAFLILPTSCTGTPLQGSADVNSWAEPAALFSLPVSPSLPTLDGCNRVPFSPSVSAEPTTDRASAPTGLDFNLNFHDEGLTSDEGIAQSQLRDTVVKLPEGLTINPSAGVGLGGCTLADYARETVDSPPGAGCPNNSKLGTVEVTTPLLPTAIHGSIYIAQPHENPFDSLVGLYVVLKNPEAGVLIKLAGKVTPDPVTGQLTTTFENNPQLAFDHFNFHFREGQQAPLISPPTCGMYTTQAELSPWSEPEAVLTDTSPFSITKGFDGGACPSGGVPPFSPKIESGTLNNNAGAFSSFYVHLTRTDAEQEISGFSTNLPSGLTGDLTGIPFCSEADIEQARGKTGAQEEAEPSCPAASRVGHTLVGTGVGAVLAYVPGKIYLAGSFHGAPFSLVSVTSAVVGPFDLGTVVLRFGLKIDPYTARVSVTPTSSEPIPTILDGIVTHVRDIRVYIDRTKFTLNPTSCNPLAIGSTLTSDLGASKTVTSSFQASNCQALGFKPVFKVSTSGKTSRAQGASLRVKLSYPAGAQANISKVKVDLPRQLPSRLTTLQKACTNAQFEANPAGCPAASRVGQAKAITPLIPVPLEGPAYFVSHGGEAFPSLIMVLQGYGVTIDLVGTTFINKAGITSSTFKSVPDQPVGSFELTLPQGKFSALAANGNLCKGKLVMPTQFDAQNGAVVHQSTKITVTGCPKTKKAKGKKAVKHRRGKRGR